MKKRLLLITLAMTLLTSGCFLKEKKLEQMFFPISLGISYQENKYKIYLQVLNTSTLSIIEIESSQSESPYVLIHSENENISKAFADLGLKALTYISAIKLKSIVFHQSVFSGQLNYEELGQYFINSPIFRTRVQVFYTNTELEDFYSVKYMLVGSSVYSHTNEEEPQIIRGFSNPTFLIDTLKNISELNRMFYIPIMDVKDGTINESDKEGKLKAVKTYYYNGICPSTYDGNTLKCLSKEDALGMRWYNELEYINEELGDNKTPINTIIDKSNWHTDIKNNSFNINIKVNAHVSLNNSSLTLKQIEEKLNNKIKTDVYNTLQIAYANNIDIYHLNDIALRKNKKLTYNLNNVTINVDSKIENTTYYKY